jgi:signal transduction histidine kinase
MRVGTRLLLPLTFFLTVVMLLAGMWLLRARERQLIAESLRETRAYATALAIALENTRLEEIDRIIARVSAEPGIYGLLLYDANGHVLAAAAPVERRSGLPASYVASLIRAAAAPTLRRSIGEERFLSIVRPLRHEGELDGAIEVLQPMSVLDAELKRTRTRHIWSAVLIMAVVVTSTQWLVRRILGRPLQEFLAGTRAVARGELNFRIPPTRSGAELEELRSEFNHMADEVQSARERVAREAEERLALERQLRHSEKLAAVGNLAASLAHEIAAPLNVVAGRAEMLRRNEQPEPQRNRNLEIIGQQIARITIIVRNLLDYAREQEVQLRPVELAGVIDGVLEFLETELARAQVHVTSAIPPVRVTGDADRLHQVFLNLVLNSIQALDAVSGPRRVAITATQEAATVVVEITDNGPGMSDAVAAQAFEPFFTTKPQRGGTGLGLAVARNIIAEHGGTIEARGGAGGRFVITLRAAESNG